MTTETETTPSPPSPGVAPPLPKRPLLAAFFAFFPGLGHVYNGLYQRAITFFALFKRSMPPLSPHWLWARSKA